MSSLPVDMRIWRARHDLTQEQAANWCGMSRRTWIRYESGQTMPRDRRLVDLVMDLQGTPWQPGNQELRDHVAEPDALPF